jgi:LysR family transcriptional regulator, transcriptional activator of nhaA
MNWINYHHLYYFLQIAESGSVSQAAKSLRLGQPTLSLQLKQLEEQVGVLFERRNRRLFLTERGQIVLKYAQEIFSRGDELKRVIERGELSQQRTIYLMAQEGVPKAIISSCIIRIRKVTQARVVVREAELSSIQRELELGRVDLLLCDHEYSQFGGMSYLPVASERMGIWASDLQKKKFSARSIRTVDKQDFILPSPGHPLRMKLDQYFLENDIVPNITVEVPDTALIKELGVQGAGLIALGETTVRSWVRAGRLHLVKMLPFEQTYWLGVPKKILKDPFLEGIKKEFKTPQE